MNRQASQIDSVRKKLADDIWIYTKKGIFLRSEIKESIWLLLNKMFKLFHGGNTLIKRVCIVGSITTKQYTDFSDVDLNIEVDEELFKKLNSEGKNYSAGWYSYMMDRFVPFLEGIVVDETQRTFSLHIYFYPFILSSDNIYEVYSKERWIKAFNFPPDDFDPDRAFWLIKFLADQFIEKLEFLFLHYKANKIFRDFINDLEDFLRDWRAYRFREANRGRAHFLSYNFSADWDSGNIFLKYLGKFAKPRRLLG